MINGTSALLIGPLGVVVYVASLALLFQGVDLVPGDRRVVEVLIVVLLTIIGVLLRMGYRDVREQLIKVQETCGDLRDRVVKIETQLEVDDA